MADITEIPLEAEELTENVQENTENNEEKTAPKKRGRPPGAKNRAKAPPPPPIPKPKAKKKPIKKVEYETESESDEEPPPPRRSRREPETVGQMDRHQLASDVLRFCNSRGSTGPTRGGVTMLVGSQTCDIVNEEETYCKQSDGPTIGSNSSAERPTPRASYCSNEAARRNSAPYSESQYADGARSPTSGELEALRLRRPRSESNA